MLTTNSLPPGAMRPRRRTKFEKMRKRRHTVLDDSVARFRSLSAILPLGEMYTAAMEEFTLDQARAPPRAVSCARVRFPSLRPLFEAVAPLLKGPCQPRGRASTLGSPVRHAANLALARPGREVSLPGREGRAQAHGLAGADARAPLLQVRLPSFSGLRAGATSQRSQVVGASRDARTMLQRERSMYRRSSLSNLDIPRDMDLVEVSVSPKTVTLARVRSAAPPRRSPRGRAERQRMLAGGPA